MPRRSSRGKQGPEDLNEIAFRVAREAIGENPKDWKDGKNPAAVVLGRLGGEKGGRARAAKLSADERSDIARHAARARWSKHR
jgi:hypothetical protein